MLRKAFQVLALVAVFLATFSAISLLIAFPLKWLWNSTLPALFGFPALSIWMALKLSLLSALLFKSYQPQPKPRNPWEVKA